MKNKLLLLNIFFLILLVLPLIFAQTYQQNREFDLKVPFEVNGSIASGDARLIVIFEKLLFNLMSLLKAMFIICLKSSKYNV